MERPLVNILYNESEVKHQIWAVFHLVYRVRCVEVTNFGQFIIIKPVK